VVASFFLKSFTVGLPPCQAARTVEATSSGGEQGKASMQGGLENIDFYIGA